MIYSFDGTPLPIVSSAIVPLVSRIPTADTPARAGAYTGVRRTAVRSATVLGTLKADNFEALKSAWADLQAVHDVDTPRALVVRDGWFYYALPESLTEIDVEATSLHYQADYKLGDPFAYSSEVFTDALTINGNTTVTVGGRRDALPTVTLNVTSTGSDGRILVSANGQTAIIRPSAAQQFRFNCRTETVELGLMSEFSGQFLSLKTGANTVNVACTGGASVSSGSISRRNRSL